MKHRKKPVVIDAEVYRRGLEDGFECSKGYNYGSGGCYDYATTGNHCDQCKLYKPYIATLEGNHRITKGDYIIIGILGERYPCKAEVFHMTYEEVL